MPSASALAIAGGRPVIASEDHATWPKFTNEDKQAVWEMLDAPASELGTPTSRYIREFERAFAAYIGVDHCVGISSGTDAIVAALVATDVQPGDHVAVPAMSFATAHAVLLAGCVPIFIDIDPQTFNLDLRQLAAVLTDRITAIIPVHLGGMPVEMDELLSIADGRVVIEDAAQAAGALYRGAHAGSLADIACFSLNVAKPLTGIDGGMCVCRDADIAEGVRRFITFGEVRLPLGPGEISPHLSDGLGGNFRMWPGAAVLAGGQLPRLDGYLATAQANAEILHKGLSALPGITPPHVPGHMTSTYHLYRVMPDPAVFGWSGSLLEFRDRLIRALRGEGVTSASVWQVVPFPRMKLFRLKNPRPWSTRARLGPLLPWNPDRYPATTRVLDVSVVLGRMPNPLLIQSRGLMHQYVEAFTKVVEHMDVVLRVPYEPLSFRPPIPAETH